MKKHYKVLILFAILLISSILSYYYLDYSYTGNQENNTDYLEKKVINTLKEIQDTNEKIANMGKYIKMPANIENQEILTFIKSEEQPDYRKTFKPPFKDYKEKKRVQDVKVAPTITQLKKHEESKPQVINNKKDEVFVPPFFISGIITKGVKKVAIMETNKDTVLVEEGDMIDDFYIDNINKNDVLIIYKKQSYSLQLRGGIGAN